MRAEAVDAARSAHSIAVGDLDGVHAGGLKCRGNGGGLLEAVLVAHGVHAVAQRDVADVEIVNHDGAPAISLA